MLVAGVEGPVNRYGHLKTTHPTMPQVRVLDACCLTMSWMLTVSATCNVDLWNGSA